MCWVSQLWVGSGGEQPPAHSVLLHSCSFHPLNFLAEASRLLPACTTAAPGEQEEKDPGTKSASLHHTGGHSQSPRSRDHPSICSMGLNSNDQSRAGKAPSLVLAALVMYWMEKDGCMVCSARGRACVVRGAKELYVHGACCSGLCVHGA